MSITLRFTHIEGLTLQQQTLHKEKDSQTWKNDPETARRDVDYKQLDSKGRPRQLDSYEPLYVTAGMRNVVLTKKGPIVHVDFRNSSLRNQLRLKTQVLTEVKGDKGAVKKEWKDSSTSFVAANTFSGAFIGDGQRAILDEMPT